MTKKSMRSTLQSLKSFDREWNISSIDELLSQEQIHEFIEKAYQNPDEPSRVYANVEFRKISESYIGKINKVISMFRKKEKDIEQLARVTKQVLQDKIKKIDLLVVYVKFLEKKLEEHGIEYDKSELEAGGELKFFSARKDVTDLSGISATTGDFIEAEEIELDTEAKPVNG